MVDFVTSVYLGYSFIAFYFIFLFVIIYVKKRKEYFSYPRQTKQYSLSIVIPCYNEEETIEGTVKAVLDSDYGNLRKIFVIDDMSTDNSYHIIKKLSEKYSRVVALQTPRNSGKASGAKKYGARFADTELIGFVDADSYPQKEAIGKMIGFFDNKDVAVVTSSILAKNKGKALESLQEIEYKIIAFTRKLLGFIDAIYVTPGPLAIYRRSIFEKVGGFDTENLTEDIEITWNILSKGYKVEMCVPAVVYTVVPNDIKHWYNQRVRWNIGGMQTIGKYKKEFFKKGMLGTFVLPFFILSWILGIVGLAIFLYRAFRFVVINYLSATYSVQTQVALLSLRDINLNPSVMLLFGVVLFLLSLAFTFIALSIIKGREFKRIGLFYILTYSVIYLLTYPLILITSAYKLARGKKNW